MIIPILFVLLCSSALFGLIFYERYLIQSFLDNFTLLLLAAIGSLALFCIISLTLLPTRWGPRIKTIWLSLLVTGLTYSTADILSGLALIPELSPALVGDEIVHHRLLPNSRSAIYNRDYSYTQRINNLGLRGPDLSVQKAPGTYRIALLGDSFTMGKGVEDNETGAFLLQKSLNQRGHRTEVLNGGVDSYAPILSLLQLRDQLASLGLNLVILNLDMGDLLQELAYQTRATYNESGYLVGVDGRHDQLALTRSQRARNWINEHLYFSRLVVYYVQHWAHQHRGINVENVVGLANSAVLDHTLGSNSTDHSGAWRQLFHSILTIRDWCNKRDIGFILTTYPWGHQVNEREWMPGRRAFIPENAVISDQSLERIRHFAQQNDIEFLDLFPAFRSYDGEDRLYFSFDMHWTPAGHRLVARELERLIADRL